MQACKHWTIFQIVKQFHPRHRLPNNVNAGFRPLEKVIVNKTGVALTFPWIQLRFLT